MKKVIQFLTKKKNGLILRGRRLNLRLRGNPRPSSYPIVTGDSFRALAKHIYDETDEFIPGAVAAGDIVFVSQAKALRYLQEQHPDIPAPYVLIVHNGDQTFGKRHTDLFDDKIIHCYAQNTAVNHPKVTPLPIGLSNFHNFEHTDELYFTPPSRVPESEWATRKDRFFYRFANETCPSVRVPLKALCDKMPLAETVRERVSQERFKEILRSYKFLVSPRGNAIDTHRPYESFHLGIIPVVEDSVALRSLRDRGLPIWIVNDWKDLGGLTEKDVAKKYAELMGKANFEAMHMDYWIAKIKESQKKALAAA